MPKLVFRNEDGSGVFVLEQDRVKIGRHTKNTIVIDNPCISNWHARLDRSEDGGYVLHDLGSDNGTYVNNRAVTRAPLRHGDTLRFGMCEADYEESPVYETDDEAEVTQRITLEALAKESASFWTATVENKRQELETLEKQIEDLRNGKHAQGPGDELPQLEDLTSHRQQREELLGDIARLENRRQEMQQLILRQDAELEHLKQKDIPDAQFKLEEIRTKVSNSHQEHRNLRNQIDEATQKLESLSGLREEISNLKHRIEALDLRHQEKDLALKSVTEELQAARKELTQARTALQEVSDKRETQLDETARARDEHQELLIRNQAAVAAIKAAEAELGDVKEEIRDAKEILERLTLNQKSAEDALKRSEETLAVHQRKTSQKLEQWEEGEKHQIEELAADLHGLRCSIDAARAELTQTQREAEQIRAQMKEEMETQKRSIADLKANQYEPTRQLCETLNLRNEELAREIAQRERFLEQLQQAIEESKATERIVSDSLASKGRELDQLESRIGAEVDRITAEVKRMQPTVVSNDPPSINDFGPIFFPKRSTPRTAPKLSNARSPRTRLVVLDPDAKCPPQDYTPFEELSYEHPLPVGFHGLAAATRGALELSLSATVERQLPVLYVPGPNLGENFATLQKLRSALPTRILLLGWHAETFMAVSDTLDTDTNFQELAALLALADGSITTDPYMNTFFDSLNESRRFLYVPPSLPWNPRTMIPFEIRGGILVNAHEFDPANADHVSMTEELREIAQSANISLTIPDCPDAPIQELLERLNLPSERLNLIAPSSCYKEHLDLLERHLAVTTFESVRFHSPALRDALLTQALLIGRTSEPTQIFFPEAFSVRGTRLLPNASQIGGVLNCADNYNRIIGQAERKLMENYSYQATSRMLDQFVEVLV